MSRDSHAMSRRRTSCGGIHAALYRMWQICEISHKTRRRAPDPRTLKARTSTLTKSGRFNYRDSLLLVHGSRRFYPCRLSLCSVQGFIYPHEFLLENGAYTRWFSPSWIRGGRKSQPPYWPGRTAAHALFGICRTSGPRWSGLQAERRTVSLLSSPYRQEEVSL